MTTHTKTVVGVVGFLLGVYIAEVSSFATEVALFFLLLSLVHVVVYFFERRGERESKEREGTVGALPLFTFSLITIIFSCSIFLGIFRGEFVQEKNTYLCEAVCSFEGEILSSPSIKDQYQIFSVRNSNRENNFYDIQITVPLYPKYQTGDTLFLTGKVSLPKITMPHFSDEGSLKSFDYLSYLHTKNTGSTMFYPHIEIVSQKTDSYSLLLKRIKENYNERLTMYLSYPESSLASGMLFGKSSLSQELVETFRVSGISHIIVLSGFNIVIVMSAVLFIFKFLPLTFRGIFASLFVITFVVMVGASASVVRATLMAQIALLALLLGRAYVAKQALLLSLFCIIFYEPNSLTKDVSLHLSFLATFGIVYYNDVILDFLKKYMHRISESFLEIFATTLSAYIMTLPYTMYTFGTVSVYSLITNILVVPLVPLAMLLSFLVLVFSYISETVSFVIGYIDTLLISLILFIAKGIEGLPFSSLDVTFSFTFMIVFYLIFFVLVKYYFVSYKNETPVTREEGILTGVISY